MKGLDFECVLHRICCRCCCCCCRRCRCCWQLKGFIFSNTEVTFKKLEAMFVYHELILEQFSIIVLDCLFGEDQKLSNIFFDRNKAHFFDWKHRIVILVTPKKFTVYTKQFEKCFGKLADMQV